MIVRLLCGFGRFVWGVAKVCIVLTMLAGFLLAVYFLRPVPVPAPQAGSILELTLTGRIADTRPVAGGLAGMIREADPVTLLGDVTDAVRYAKKDPRIAGILLRVDDLEGIGGASARVIGEALDEYRRETGKHVWCYGWNFTQAQYAVAAHADRLWLHPMGRVDVKGLSGETLYWGSFLKHLGVEAEVYKAGDFKSAPEVFERSEPTKENLAAQRSYLSDAWTTMLDAWKAGRGWKDDAWKTYREAQNALEPMPEGEARHQRRYGLVDETGDEAAFRAALRKAYAKDGKEVALTNLYDFLDSSDPAEGSGPGVAVLYAEGEMVDDPRMGRLLGVDGRAEDRGRSDDADGVDRRIRRLPEARRSARGPVGGLRRVCDRRDAFRRRSLAGDLKRAAPRPQVVGGLRLPHLQVACRRGAEHGSSRRRTPGGGTRLDGTAGARSRARRRTRHARDRSDAREGCGEAFARGGRLSLRRPGRALVAADPFGLPRRAGSLLEVE